MKSLLARPARTCVLLFCATSFCAALPSSAALVTVPTDLNLGDKYRLAFVTSTTRDAMSTDIADYNAFVTGVAAAVPELAALGTTWTAIASTSAVAARDNTGTNPMFATGVPIYRLDDTRIAANNTDLWDATIQAPLATYENGALVPFFQRAWTGSTTSGESDPSYPLGSALTRWGVPDSSNYVWIFFDVQSTTHGGTNHVYAISDELTVVPEPDTMTLICIGTAAVVGWQFRLRRNRILP